MVQPDCIETTRARTSRGYGLITVGGRGRRMWRHHRYAWTLANGPIPSGLVVMHTCDNPPCINVAHLRLGTHADNIADRDAKGHTARGARNGNAKNSEETVRQIRARAAAGESGRLIARDLGLNEATVHRIVNRRTWAHVDVASV